MKLKSKIKKFLIRRSGYWFAKRSSLSTGIDLFYDIARTSGKPIEVIFDAGANEGQSVSYFKSEYPNAHIYSFEPVKSLVPILEANTKEYKNVYLECAALGDKLETRHIRLFEDKVHSSLNSLDPKLMNDDREAAEQEVKITTLDHYVNSNGIDKIDLLKMDVEKWEMQVLNGGINSLKERKIRYILCEVGFSKENIRHTDFIEIFKFLRELNFSFIGIYELRLFNNKGHFGNALFKLEEG